MPAPQPEDVPGESAAAPSATLRSYWAMWDMMQRGRFVAQAEAAGFIPVPGSYDASSPVFPRFNGASWLGSPTPGQVVYDPATGLPADVTTTLETISITPTGPMADAFNGAGAAVGDAIGGVWDSVTGTFTGAADAAKQAATLAAILAGLAVLAFIILRK